LGEDGECASVRTREPVNRFPDFVRYLVQWLKVMCPRLGKVKTAQILCRAGLHLGPTTVGRMIKEPPPTFPRACEGAVSGRVVTAKRPDHVWHIDLSAVAISGGFWTTWNPFAVFPCWPFGWWIVVLLDHFSRRVQGFEVFDRRPDSQSMISFLDRVILQVGAKPKYLISDQEAQFDSDEVHEWCRPKEITQRFGALGEHGSIAVLERLIQTVKVECTRLILIPFRRGAMVAELEFFFHWYNEHRPHTTLEVRTPNEVYHDLPPACQEPRLEPRPGWPPSSPCAAPEVPVRSTRGAVHLQIGFLHRRKHLPIVTLSHAA
jgi:transposase InsO family protein